MGEGQASSQLPTGPEPSIGRLDWAGGTDGARRGKAAGIGPHMHAIAAGQTRGIGAAWTGGHARVLRGAGRGQGHRQVASTAEIHKIWAGPSAPGRGPGSRGTRASGRGGGAMQAHHCGGAASLLFRGASRCDKCAPAGAWRRLSAHRPTRRGVRRDDPATSDAARPVYCPGIPRPRRRPGGAARPQTRLPTCRGCLLQWRPLQSNQSLQ